MHACDLAEHHNVVFAFQPHNLRHFAFQRGRGRRHAGAIDRLGFGFFQGGERELVGLFVPGPGRFVHRIAQGEANDVDDKKTGLLYIRDGVLGAVPVGFRAGRGEHDLRRHIGGGVKERIGREVIRPVRATC